MSRIYRPIPRPLTHFLRCAWLLLPALAAAQTSPPAGATDAATLPTVTVSGTRLETSVMDTPASVDIVDGARVRADAMQINLSENLAGVPGLQLQNRQNYAQDLQISIRGFGARSTFGVRGLRLYVDGIPATMPDGQGQTSNIDIGTIDRVEVLRGPFSALYGNSSGGVLQVYTEDGRQPSSLTAGVAAGSNGTWRYSAQANGATGNGVGDIDYVVGVSRFTTDGYRDHSGARKNLANAKIGLRPDQDSRLTLVLNSVDLTANDPLGLTRQQYESDPRQAPLAEQYNTRKTVNQTQGGLLYERAVNADNDLRVMVYYGQRETTQYQSIPPGPQMNPNHAGGVIDLQRDYGGADLRWTSRLKVAGSPLTLVSGLAYDSLRETRRGYENYVGTGASQVLGVKGALRRDERNEVYNVDPYLQASWQFAERWTLDAGLRYSTVRFDSDDRYITAGNGDDSGSARYRRALPVTALRYAVSPDTNVYVSYGRGFETPTSNELSYRPDGLNGLNFALKPSVSDNLEAGVKTRVGEGLLTAAVFHSTTDDEIVSAGSNNGRTSYRNAGRTRRDGVELAWSGAVVSNLRADMAYTYLRAKYRDDVAGSGIAAGNDIPGIARQSAYAALRWAPPQGFHAGVEGRYLSRIYVNDANSDSASGYFIAALSAGYLWQAGPWTFDAFARVDNLFDRDYIGSVIVNEGNLRYFEPAPGRTWGAGLTASYRF